MSYQYNTFRRINQSKFTLIDGEMDYRVYRRTFSGRMTKLRWKIIDSWCRANSYNTRCHHEWDCCGCLCGESTAFEYKQNQVTVTLTQSFNY